jgi:viologen exporter family transport system permease protein
MRVFIEVARRSFQRQFAYRGAALAGMVANTMFGVIIASVYRGLYASQPGTSTVEGFDLTEILTYVWISQSLISVIALWGWYDVARSVQSGEIVTDLVKPVGFYGFWLSRDVGRAVSQVILRGIPTLVVGSLLFDLNLPSSVLRWIEFAVCVVLALLVSFAVRFMVNISAVWLTDVLGIAMMTTVAVNFFSGFLVPISFFPVRLVTIANALPFRAMIMAPVTVGLGQSSFKSAAILQLFWIVVMTTLALWTLSRATRRLETYGG